MKRVVSVFLLFAGAAAATWDPEKATSYLETRHREWAGWKYSQRPGGACLSCHTGLPYLFAMRARGRATGGFAQGARVRLHSHRDGTAFPGHEAAESVLDLVALAFAREPGSPLTETDRAAVARLWKYQTAEGEAKGSWKWFLNGLDPMDTAPSYYYGAALAEFALARFPEAPKEATRALQDLLRRDSARQPLHNRLAWIAFGARGETSARSAVLKSLWAAQAADGGWTIAALGPWEPHPDAPPRSGSDAYATAWSAFAARESGVDCGHPRLKRAVGWLARNQDPATGAWKSPSMNQVYEPGSMQEKFMTDAATGWAVAALSACPLVEFNPKHAGAGISVADGRMAPRPNGPGDPRR